MQELTEAAARGELPSDLVTAAAAALLDESGALEDKAAFLSAL